MQWPCYSSIGSESLITLLKVSRQSVAELGQAQLCLSLKPVLYPQQIRGLEYYLFRFD